MSVLYENISLLVAGWAFIFFVVGVFRLVRAVMVAFPFRLRPRMHSTFPIDSDRYFETMSLGVTSELVF